MNSQLGSVVIRTKMGDKMDGDGFFNQEIMRLFLNQGLHDSLDCSDKVYAGPFCYTAEELELPF